MGGSFCGVPSKHTQDWAVNNHMLQTGLSLAEYFCNKTPKKFSKICQNRSSEVKETINFKIFRGLTAPPPPPPRPPAGFLVGIHIKIIPVTPLRSATLTRSCSISVNFLVVKSGSPTVRVGIFMVNVSMLLKLRPSPDFFFPSNLTSWRTTRRDATSFFLAGDACGSMAASHA